MESFLHPSWLDVLTDPVRLSLLRSLVLIGPATVTELASHTHTADPTVRRHLEALAALGLVHEAGGESDGLTRGRPAARFALDAAAEENARELFKVLERPLLASSARSPVRRLGR